MSRPPTLFRTRPGITRAARPPAPAITFLDGLCLVTLVLCLLSLFFPS